MMKGVMMEGATIGDGESVKYFFMIFHTYGSPSRRLLVQEERVPGSVAYSRNAHGNGSPQHVY